MSFRKEMKKFFESRLVYLQKFFFFLLLLFSGSQEKLEAQQKAALAVFIPSTGCCEVRGQLEKEFSSAIALSYYKHSLRVLREDLERLETDFDIFICPEGEGQELSWLKNYWPRYEVLSFPKPHTQSSLGVERIANSILERGYSEVLVMHKDTPSLPLFHIHQCQDLLASSDVVLGPSENGCCYLLGTKRPLARVCDTSWCSEYFLESMQQGFSNLGYTVIQGPRWYTVSGERQLWKLCADLVGSQGNRARLLNWVKTLPKVSIVVPVLNEKIFIASLSSKLKALDPQPEILFVDGGSQDGTVEAILSEGLTPIEAIGASYGKRLNEGILRSRAPLVLCLNPDSLFTQEGYEEMLQAMREDPELKGGAFAFALDGAEEDWRKRVIEGVVKVRNKLFHMPYSDQAYFMRKSALDEVGLFQDIPVMEDVEWFGRLKDTGHYMILEHPVQTSGRRTLYRGWLRSGFLNATVLTLYKLGVDPTYLPKWGCHDLSFEEEIAIRESEG